ncbi:hypothetical protein [Amycolatopsis sp. NPDC059657]|uniref:hypothetical protein n=1 Tax=Amycolatopsis sp. NPDC059657 TaxID=3346899 RepID=UPI00366D1FE3
MRNTLPEHTTKRHPITGQPLTALGYKKNGSPIWPILGGSTPIGTPPAGATPPAAPPTPAPPATPPAAPAAPPPAAPAAGATPTPPAADALGPAGLAALAAEREKNADLVRQLAAATAAQNAGMTDQERTAAALAQMQKDLAFEKQERFRLTAANTHSIPATHLHLLTATDEAGLEAQAKTVGEMLAAIAAAAGGTPPATPPGTPPPAPLPGQGTPPAPPATTSVASGRELYAQRNPQKT